MQTSRQMITARQLSFIHRERKEKVQDTSISDPLPNMFRLNILDEERKIAIRLISEAPSLAQKGYISSQESGNSEKSVENPCGICCNEVNFFDAQLEPCKHVFCRSCILDWFGRENTCPTCRARIGFYTTPSAFGRVIRSIESRNQGDLQLRWN